MTLVVALGGNALGRVTAKKQLVTSFDALAEALAGRAGMRISG